MQQKKHTCSDAWEANNWFFFGLIQGFDLECINFGIEIKSCFIGQYLKFNEGDVFFYQILEKKVLRLFCVFNQNQYYIISLR